MKTISILQPSYLPWIGYFEQIERSDVFVFYNDVQYTKNDWRNRNKIKTPKGWEWLTVPVKSKGKFGAKINEVDIMEGNAIKKHFRTLSINYSKSPFFATYKNQFSDFYEKKWKKLSDLNIELIKMVCGNLGLERKMICSSELGIVGERSERLLEICEHFDADVYYSGAAAKDYIDISLFEQNKIKVIFQDYQHPTYPQLYGDFISHLSIVDLLFNCGPKSLNILKTEEKND